MRSKENPKRSLVKAVSYRVVAIFVTFGIAYVLTENFYLSASIGLADTALKIVVYYIHERFWDRTKFGVQTIPDNGFTLWFTGLSGAGKSTLADAVARELEKYSIPVEKLDGDIVRQTICKDLGFSAEDRQKNIERVTQVAKILTKNRAAVLASFISPYKQIREQARKEIGNDFIEVHVKCPLGVCIERDPKGLYKKALAGEIKNFTGISDPYEEPESPEITVETHKENVDQCTKKIIRFLKDKRYLT